MTIQYFYFDSRILGSANIRDQNILHIPGGYTGFSLSKEPLNPLPDVGNPCFNFDANFINGLLSLSAIEVGKCVPYISLSSIGLDGKEIDNFNLKFFHKNVDMTAINQPGRYPERPELSLKSVNIGTDLASGFLYFTNISIHLKMHKPDLLTNSTLVSILFPGMPLKLTYGWTGPNPPNFLSKQEILYFNVKNYTMTFDITGQADITIEGISTSQRFNNVLVGDVAEQITQADIANGSEIASNAQVAGLYYSKNQIDEYIKYLNDLKSRQGSGGARDITVITRLAKTFQSVQLRASGKIKKNFSNRRKALRQLVQPGTRFFTGVATSTFGVRKSGSFVTVHDIVSTLLGDTLNTLEGTIIPSGKNFRFVYGALNENLGNYSRFSIADFPIEWTSFNAKLKDARNDGADVPTLQWVLNVLISDFINNEQYWRNNIVRDGRSLNIPDVALVDSSFAIAGEEFMQLAFIDRNKDLPITTNQLRALGSRLASQQETINAVIGQTNMPVIEIGHANSFVKSINMQHYNDESMKAVFINRALENQVGTARLPISANAAILPQDDRALFLPLKGEMEVLGHVDWKPTRFFYLSTGIFFIDAVYKILSVNHDLSPDGFKTRMTFGYH